MRIALIPARGGSRRLPRKNVLPFAGKPLICYSIQNALYCGFFDHVVVSSDDEEIKAIAMTNGAKFHQRSPEMAMDEVGTQEVARSVLIDLLPMVLEHGYPKTNPGHADLACVIYPTAPLMHPDDLKRGRYLLESDRSKQYAFAVGAEPLRDAGNWYWGRISAFLTRLPLIASHTVMVPIPEERVCDINVQEDFDRALILYRAAQEKERKLA